MSSNTDLATADRPTDLIRGDPATVARVATVLQRYADSMADAARGFTSLDTSSWTGAAADTFRRRFSPAPTQWQTGSDAFAQAAAATGMYAATVELAQQDAARALTRYQQAVDAERAATAPTAAPLLPRQPAPGRPTTGPWAWDRIAAIALLDDARQRVRTAATLAHNAVRDATSRAPEPPPWHLQAAASVLTVGDTIATVVYNNVLVPTVNVLSDIGRATAANPDAALATVGGVLLTVLSGAGDGAGIALSATGVGAIAGVPLTAAAALGVTAGITMIAAGVSQISDSARTQNSQILHRVGKVRPDPSDPATTRFDPNTARGKTSPELESQMPASWGPPSPSTSGEGRVYVDPENRGRRFRFMDGYPPGTRSDARKEASYVVVSQNGQKAYYLFTDVSGVLE